MTKASADVDIRDLLADIDAPTLLVWGEKDRRGPLHVVEQFRAAMPAADLAIISGAGHVSNMEQPAAFNYRVRRFCVAQGASGLDQDLPCMTRKPGATHRSRHS